MKYSRVSKTGKLVEFLYSRKDHKRIMQYNWYHHNEGYLVTNMNDGVGQRHVKLHRWLLDAPNGMEVDHINGDITDNRRTNLRIVTKSQNQMNTATRKDNTSGVKGINWHKRDECWIIRIQINGKRIQAKGTNCLEEAKRIRENLEKKYQGEYRRT